MIIPGWSNSGPVHWQRIWEREDPSFTLVEQSNWLNPDLTDWIGTIDRAVSHAVEPAVIV
ncbi:MAG: RBBP9/YdeN family alpha/beta hydrolase, partial [Gemmatimonadaceae bacterium]